MSAPIDIRRPKKVQFQLDQATAVAPGLAMSYQSDPSMAAHFQLIDSAILGPGSPPQNDNVAAGFQANMPKTDEEVPHHWKLSSSYSPPSSITTSQRSRCDGEDDQTFKMSSPLVPVDSGYGQSAPHHAIHSGQTQPLLQPYGRVRKHSRLPSESEISDLDLGEAVMPLSLSPRMGSNINEDKSNPVGPAGATARVPNRLLDADVKMEELESVAVTSDTMSISEEHVLAWRNRRREAARSHLNMAFEAQDLAIRSMSAPNSPGFVDVDHEAVDSQVGFAGSLGTSAAAAAGGGTGTGTLRRPAIHRSKTSFSGIDAEVLFGDENAPH